MTTITIERAVLLRALEALRPATAPNGAKRDAAFEELRAALAAPATAPEPVAWMSPKRFYRTRAMALTNGEQLIEPLYLHPPATAPAQPERKPPQQDASLSATTKALTFARTALLVVNSGASQKAIALIDDALNQAPVQAQVLNPLTDGEKIYALWHSSDANDLDDFLDGWRHAEAFHGIKETP